MQVAQRPAGRREEGRRHPSESQASVEGIAHVVVGVGVNLEMPDDVDGAGAIGNVEPEDLLTDFLRRLRALMEGPAAEVVARWRAVSETLGRRRRGHDRERRHARGVAVDVDETGALLVDSDAAASG